MSSVGLLLVGAVLFVNGLVFLGFAEPRGAAIINIFVGLLQTAVPFYLLANASSADDILNAAPIFLFGLTYLWTGISNLTGHDPSGLGWFCLWVMLMTIAFSTVSFVRFDDVKQGVIWLNWGLLWGLFWLILALGQDKLTQFAGWATVLTSFWTCTIPAILTLVGVWGDAPDWVAIGATAIAGLAAWTLTGRTIGQQRTAAAVG
jgi:hypothetical protein